MQIKRIPPLSSRIIELADRHRDNQLSPRQSELLQVALAILRTDGIDGLTLRRVAQEDGVQLASIQYHFGSKQGLIEALLDFALDWYGTQLISLTAAHGQEPVTTFQNVVKYLVKDLKQRSGLEPHLWALCANSVEGQEKYQTFMRLYREFLFHLLSALGTIDTEKQQWHRAAQITALIEGFYQIVSTGTPSDLKGFESELEATIYQIAGLDELA